MVKNIFDLASNNISSTQSLPAGHEEFIIIRMLMTDVGPDGEGIALGSNSFVSYRPGYFVGVPDRIHDIPRFSGITNEIEAGEMTFEGTVDLLLRL